MLLYMLLCSCAWQGPLTAVIKLGRNTIKTVLRYPVCLENIGILMTGAHVVAVLLPLVSEQLESRQSPQVHRQYALHREGSTCEVAHLASDGWFARPDAA